EGPQQGAVRGEDRARPAGAEPVRLRQLAVRIPEGVRADVLHDDTGSPEGSRPAGALQGTDARAIEGSHVGLRQMRRAPVMERLIALVVEQDRAQDAPPAGLDELDDGVQ